MKKVLAVIFSLILSILIVYGLPLIRKEQGQIIANTENDKSLVPQEILSYGDKEKAYDKIYYEGKLKSIKTMKMTSLILN